MASRKPLFITGGQTQEVADDDQLTTDGTNVIQQTLTANKTIHVSTTGNDTTGDGSSGSPFATLNRAAENVSQFVPAGFTITVKFAAGIYTFTESYEPTYAYGPAVTFTGVDHQVNHGSGIALSNFDVSYSTDGSFSRVQYFDMDVTLTGAGTAVTVGEFLLVRNATGGTNPEACNGLHKIEAYDSGTEVATVRVWSSDGVNALPSGSVTADPTQIRVILKYNLSSGTPAINVTGLVDSGEFVSLVIEANDSSEYDSNIGINIQRGGECRFNTIGIHGWKTGMFADKGGIAGSSGTAGISKCKDQGVQCAFHAHMDMGSAYINGCGLRAVIVQYSQYRQQNGFIVGVGIGVRADMGDALLFGTGLFYGDGSGDVGIQSLLMSRVDARSTTITGFTTATSTATGGQIET